MLIYNTLTRKKEEFKPIDPPNVTMYVCGPTVYDYFHIGNARSFIMSDIIRKYLEYKNYNVNYVMNLTDIDDRIIKKANTENTHTKYVSEKFIDAFFEDIKKLRIKPATSNPKATEHVNEITDLISRIKEKEMAYEVNGDVFFNVNSFSEYGKLSGKKVDELEAGARIDINEAKKNPLDFALWKSSKPGEPYWESPWGKGRPGWHIECSAMSMKHLGKTIDIHAGGSDLIFPHHENEIAQSEAANGAKFVNYWIHFGFLNINEEKMSKSLGNFFTAREILKKYSPGAIRLLYSQTHYAGPLNYSEELIASAEKGLEKINNLAARLKYELQKADSVIPVPDFDFKRYYDDFESAMDDDFNSPQAVAVIFDFVREANRSLNPDSKFNPVFIQNCLQFLKRTADKVLGIIDLSEEDETQKDSIENELISFILDIRLKLKQEKNYKLSDEIRNGLLELGIAIEDSKTGSIFKRVNK